MRIRSCSLTWVENLASNFTISNFQKCRLPASTTSVIELAPHSACHYPEHSGQLDHHLTISGYQSIQFILNISTKNLAICNLHRFFKVFFNENRLLKGSNLLISLLQLGFELLQLFSFRAELFQFPHLARGLVFYTRLYGFKTQIQREGLRNCFSWVETTFLRKENCFDVYTRLRKTLRNLDLSNLYLTNPCPSNHVGHHFCPNSVYVYLVDVDSSFQPLEPLACSSLKPPGTVTSSEKTHLS